MRPIHVLALLVLTLTWSTLAGCGDPPAAAPAGDAPAPASPAPLPGRPPTLAVPVGQPVQLDGQMPAGEWEGALELALGEDAARVHLMQVRGTLLMGLDVAGRWPTGGTLWIVTAPDATDAGFQTPSATRIDFEPLEHNRPHLMVFRQGETAPEPVEGKAVFQGRAWPSRYVAEFAIRLDALGVVADPTRAGPRLALLWYRGRDRTTLTWPPGLSVGAAVGRAPPDLASCANWARTQAWEDPSGPGALPAAEWARLVEEEAELTRRGTAAHQLALLMADAAELPKIDREQVPILEGNLRWIAEREPLTPYDVFALSRGLSALNRKDEALAMLDGLASHADWQSGPSILYDRARTLETMDRFEEAAEAWRALAARTPGGQRPAYEGAAERAMEHHEAWLQERLAREEDRVRTDLPLVLLRTNRGDVLIQLFEDDVPEAVRHFLGLVRRREGEGGFYDGTLFHRVIGSFLAQGGDPMTRDGDCEAGGSSDGPSMIGVEENPRHGFFRGAIGFARDVRPLNGCQFFILTAAKPDLGDRGFTCFGWVMAGMDVVDRLEQCDVLLEARVIRDEE